MKPIKWQRIRYMPATPLGEDGRRVTASQAHIDLSHEAACEGMSSAWRWVWRWACSPSCASSCSR